ncbi:MAG TPA: glycosyltransferase family 25 protein [Stellaceae bacterium]|nr:glycosyltransferase family 25 protein [Stellaceae bacterium]
MDVTVINLDRSADRLATFARRNGHLRSVTRFAAVDGRGLDAQRLIADGVIEPAVANSYTKGALGCALSHRALWEAAISGQRPITICEDDAIFNRRFEDTAATLIERALPPDWDIVLWGYNFDEYVQIDLLPGVSRALMQFDQEAMRKGVALFQDSVVAPLLLRLHRALGCMCYSISPKGAGLLRGHCFPLRDMMLTLPGRRVVQARGIDIPMNEAYPGLKAFACMPPLAITENDHGISTTQRPD